MAAREAAARPWPAGTTVHIVAVVEPIYGWGAPEVEELLRQSAEQTVQTAAEYFKHSGLEVASVVLMGDPKTLLLDEAERRAIDLILLGAHGTSGILQFLMGSVARAMVHLAHCSVEIVRNNPGPRALKVLLAADGSEHSNAAAQAIANRPWPTGTAVRILTVVEPSLPLLHTPYFHADVLEEMRGKDMQRAQEAVASAEKILGTGGLDVSSLIAVPAATPKELILSEAAEWCADLIVAGSHGRRGVQRFLLGSVSEAVALHANCSVEIVRHTLPAA